MAGLRQKVWEILTEDPTLNGLGIDASSLFVNHAPDSPAEDLMRFGVLRWGTAEVAPGADTSARPIAMSFWSYDRETDYGNILATLKRVRAVVAGLPGMRFADGALLGADFAFSSEDLYDQTYRAVLRSETYRLVASGI